jgi:hypothetical protein
MRRFPMRWMKAAVLVALPVCAACERDPCGLGTMADTAGWRVVDAGPFVFKLPPGYRDEYPLGADSYVGTWTQGERSVTFAWGPHTADPREPQNRPRGTQCEARVGGRDVVVTESRERALGGGQVYDVGGWWQKADSLGASLSLRGTGPADDEAGRAIATTVLRTVRLRTAWSAQDSLRFHHRICEISRVAEARFKAEHPDAPSPVPPGADPRNCPAGPAPPPPDYDRVR